MKKLALVLAAAVVCAGTLTAGTASAWTGSGWGVDRYQWTEVTPQAQWSPRAGLQAVQLRDGFFVMGGRTPVSPEIDPSPFASKIWSDVWRSDDKGQHWRQVAADDASHWPARAYFQAVTRGGSMYVMGGQNYKVTGCPAGVASCSDFFNDVWRSFDGKNWRQLTSNAGWEGRAGLSATVLNGAFYIMGGSRNDDAAIGGDPFQREYFNDVWRSYDGVHWKAMTTKAGWAPRAGASLVTRGDWMYLFGGEAGFTCPTFPGGPPTCDPPYFNDVWRSKDGAHWQQVTSQAAWSGRPGQQCQLMLGQFVCFGGFGLFGNPVDRWASFDGARWRQLPSSPWNAASGDDIKYDFAAFVDQRFFGLRPNLYTFGGDRETFNFGDPTNYLRVDNDVWRFGPRALFGP